MGLLLFTESGEFNPADVGLSIGDMIQYVVVGGGGGGSAPDSGGVGIGGDGGPSSFGSYATALGGSGGSISMGTQGQFRGGKGLSGRCTSSNTQCCAGGGGAGGWSPSSDVDGGNGPDGILVPFEQVQTTVVPQFVIPKTVGLAGANGSVICIPGWSSVVSEGDKYGGRELVNAIYSSNHTTIWHRGCRGVLSGAGRGYAYTNDSSGGGGTGFGAGGGMAGGQGDILAFSLSYAGNSGEVKRGFLVLQSVEAIPVTVGGGGGGGATCDNVRANGTNGSAGSAGAGGAASSSHYDVIGGSGGYGNTPAGDGKDGARFGTSLARAGGGGAGGCVAVFW